MAIAARPLISTLLLSAGLLLTSRAMAAEEREAWTPTPTAIRASAAGVAMPQSVAGLSLTKSGEASNGGRAIDNYAQYMSDDGAIQATFYIYLPTYADASLAAYMTDKAIMERFGGKTRRTAYAAAPVSGQQGRAIRAVYEDAGDGALVTGAAFVHAGRWIVKLRVTGPTARKADVVAGLDGLLAALQVDDAASLHAVAPARLSPCAVSAPPAEKADAFDAAGQIPRDGKDRLCIRDTVATSDGKIDMLQQAGRPDGPVIVPIDDSGSLLAFDPAADGKGYRLSLHMIGQTEFYGSYDRVPTPAQVAAIIDGDDPQTAQADAVAAYDASGAVTMTRVAQASR